MIFKVAIGHPRSSCSPNFAVAWPTFSSAPASHDTLGGRAGAAEAARGDGGLLIDLVALDAVGAEPEWHAVTATSTAAPSQFRPRAHNWLRRG
jgi:hypothetical protein